MNEPDIGPIFVALDEAAANPSIFQSFVLMAAIIGIMYVVLYLPQQRERKKHEELLAGLQKDDEVITRGGIYGKVLSVNEARVVLEVGPRNHITVDRTAVAEKVVEEASDNK